MPKLATPKYTAVQHSGYGYAGKPEFKYGLEVRKIDTEAALNRVESCQGIIFDSWSEADDFCTEEPYPEDYEGLVPQAPGGFAFEQIDGLRVYVPKQRIASDLPLFQEPAI